MVLPTILIPAYRPTNELTTLVRDLRDRTDHPIVVVDDGGGSAYKELFSQVAAVAGVTVLHHAVNLGKGAALKTGLNHVLWTTPDGPGVVTADADGQHRVDDILAVCDKIRQAPGRLVMGTRVFTGAVPLRSKFGNRFTVLMLRLTAGISLADTQTGLRGIPRTMIPDLLRISARGYEFELDMILLAKSRGVEFSEVPIATIYIEGNASSHFNPILDSLKIYFVLFRFALSSLATTIVDFLVFALATTMGFNVISSLVSARVVAVAVNYLIVRNVVFHSGIRHQRTLPKFLLLVVVFTTATYFIIGWLNQHLMIGVILAKAIAETTLFFVNFAIQRELVFATNEPTEER